MCEINGAERINICHNLSGAAVLVLYTHMTEMILTAFRS
jgi:hypothetical protein